MSSIEYKVHYAPLPALGTDVLKIIEDNFVTVMTYAFSQKALGELCTKRYSKGTFKFLNRAFFETPQRKATRALIELALTYRALDDAQDISSAFSDDSSFGRLHKSNNTIGELPLRELINKIIHSDKIEWVFEDHLDDPLIICYASKNQVSRFKWIKAEVPASSLADACCGFF